MEDKYIPQRGVRCLMTEALWYHSPDIHTVLINHTGQWLESYIYEGILLASAHVICFKSLARLSRKLKMTPSLYVAEWFVEHMLRILQPLMAVSENVEHSDLMNALLTVGALKVWVGRQ
jgi:hypothetical protein